MELTFTHFLFVCSPCIFAGFIDAIAGGGGLVCIPLVMNERVPDVWICGGMFLAVYKK